MNDFKIKIWQGEKLGNTISLDTETNLAPFHSRDHKMITCQVYDGNGVVYFIEKSKVMKFMKQHKKCNIVMQHAPFDVGVLSKITGTKIWYDMYDNDLIWDTKIMYILYTLAATGQASRQSSLKLICEKLLGIDIDKNADIRTTFEQFENTPILEIPEEHLRYAALDAIYTYDVYFKLKDLIRPHDKMNTTLSHHIQVKGALALDAIYKNGLGFDLDRGEKTLSDLNGKIDTLKQRLAMWGYVQGRAGISDQYERIMVQLGLDKVLPRSDKSNKISQKSDDLKMYSDMPFVGDYLEFDKLHKLSTFIRDIKTDTVHGRFNPILNTGRTSMSRPNLQQIPRSGGIRECFVPKKANKKFFIIDYSGMENAMLSQVLINKYGYSEMASKINAGMDLHRYYASILFEKDIKNVTKEERQQAKAAVFGFPGGLGLATFMQFASGYGLSITEDEARVMKDKYFQAFPEMERYLKECDEGDVFTLTGRKRADATYCAVANTPFQGLGADMAKIAMYELTKAGFEVVAFIHDEFIIEHKDSIEDFNKACDIMVQAGKKIAPDMLIEVEGHILDKWEKL